jgi:hypothetical protein
MRLAGQILSIGGGLYGVLHALMVTMTGSLGVTYGLSNQAPVIAIGVILLLISLAGIVGGAITSTFRARASLLQAGAGLVGFVLTPIGWLLTGSALLLGAILTCAGRDR